MCAHPRCVLAALLALAVAAAAQSREEEYAQKIKEYTTDPRFSNEWVDHLPHKAGVPSPLDHFGHIVGTPDILHHVDEIHGYFRALAKASPRVHVRSIGKSEEGREMIEVIVTDAERIKNLDRIRSLLQRLADPRKLDDETAKRIIGQAKPVYYITAGLHSPETGPPEMVMELAYRLAVEETPFIRRIRQNVVTVIVPATDPDGRDRMVDVWNYRKDHKGVAPPLIYWGHYVAHDNNRDGFGLGLALTRNILASWHEWRATVFHDLHESVPYLYVSTGTGPYNQHLDPITIDEWHDLAHNDVTELTRRGMPGVWTHAFYTGWAANYLMWMANTRNAVGRFYETFGNSIAGTHERELGRRSTRRTWYRPNPPLKKTQWSLRNNTNYMQSGVLASLDFVARNRRRFVENFWLKSKRAVERGKTEAPYAWVIPLEQRRARGVAEFFQLLQQQRIEVHLADKGLTWSDPAPKGKKDAEPKKHTLESPAYVVRCDQPFNTLIRVLLGKQEYPPEADPPYDDTGWTLPLLWGIEAHRVDDPKILEAAMSRAQGSGLPAAHGVEAKAAVYALNHTTDDQVAVFRFRLKDVEMEATEEAFEADGRKYNAGTLLIAGGNGVAKTLGGAALELGLTVRALKEKPKVPTHKVAVPRIGFVHTWVSTPQDAGWWRMAFDKIGIPYTYLSEQDLATTDLSKLDVLVLPRCRATPQTLVHGRSRAGDPIPWKKDPRYPHLGRIDETDDVRRGMGLDGLARLKRFLEGGGVLITEGGTAAFPIDMGLVRRVSIRRTRDLQARGCVVRAEVADKKSPITYGYGDSFAVYFNQAPVFSVQKRVKSFRTPDWLADALWKTEVPRIVLRFAKKDLLMSGMLRGSRELAGAPAVIDVPVGKGHVVLFANRPFWRWQTRGSHALVFNTMLHFDHLRTGWPEPPDEEEEQEQTGKDQGDD